MFGLSVVRELWRLASDDHPTRQRICLLKPRVKRALSTSGQHGRHSNEAHTDDELVKTEITHYVCGSCLGVRLEREMSAVLASYDEMCHHFDTVFCPVVVVSVSGLCSSPCFGPVCPKPQWLSTV